MKAALFDLDGVLIDSEGVYTKFWKSVGDEYGLPESFALDIKGTTLTDILNNFATDRDRENVMTKIHDFEETMIYEVFPGVMEFLRNLRNRGFKTAIVTSSDDKKMSFLAKQQPELLSMFDAVITGSMVTKSKPDPQGYLFAAEKVGVDIAECYVFEDSFQGIEAGRRAGAVVIGLATTNSAESIKDKAHKVIYNFVGFTV